MDSVRDAARIGLTNIGENYVQEAQFKQKELDGGHTDSITWHLIGHLQRNKVQTAVRIFSLIQTVDSMQIILAIERHAQAQGKIQDILIQVKLGEEESKTGVAKDEVNAFAELAATCSNVKLKGLMAVAPLNQDARPYFAQAREMFDVLPTENRSILCMGMSNDFITAIQEGATLVRIGTALFGAR